MDCSEILKKKFVKSYNYNFLPIDPEGQQGVEPDVEHAVCKRVAVVQRPLAFGLAVERKRVVMRVG